MNTAREVLGSLFKRVITQVPGFRRLRLRVSVVMMVWGSRRVAASSSVISATISLGSTGIGEGLRMVVN
jgi:hypothetical protein